MAPKKPQKYKQWSIEKGLETVRTQKEPTTRTKLLYGPLPSAVTRSPDVLTTASTRPVPRFARGFSEPELSQQSSEGSQATTTGLRTPVSATIPHKPFYARGQNQNQNQNSLPAMPPPPRSLSSPLVQIPPRSPHVVAEQPQAKPVLDVSSKRKGRGYYIQAVEAIKESTVLTGTKRTANEIDHPKIQPRTPQPMQPRIPQPLPKPMQKISRPRPVKIALPSVTKSAPSPPAITISASLAISMPPKPAKPTKTQVDLRAPDALERLFTQRLRSFYHETRGSEP